MPAEVKKEIELEIAHVLFLDIVGYSKLSVNEQHARVDELNGIVRLSEQFQKAEAANRILKIPTGDGMALVFYKSPEEPAQCAFEISRALKDNQRLQVRMGIHSGPVSGVVDVNERTNVAGAGINLAQRVMDCGDAGHILLSHHVAEDLAEYERWRPFLHDIGTFEVKHGARVSVTNLYSDEVGNPNLPSKLQAVKKHHAHVRWAAVAIGLLVVAALAAAVLSFLRKGPARSLATAVEKSIAVLPFENLSSDKENAFFTDGVQDEILTDLAKIADLKVISRTSVMQYKSGAPRNLREIGQQLGVAHVVEGSVQRAANKVRVNAQLIDARNDAHLWAQTYDRDLADVFAIQSEIAKAIADQLQAKLSPNEKKAIEQPPTTDLAAFDLYSRAKSLLLTAGFSATSEPDLRKAIELLDEAVKRDPSFFDAYCQLAYAHEHLYAVRGLITLPPGLRWLKLRCKPRHGCGRMLPKRIWRAHNISTTGCATMPAPSPNWRLRGERYPMIRVSSNSPATFCGGAASRRKVCSNLQRAVELDPRNFYTLQQIALSYQVLGRYAEAIAALDRALAIVPDNVETRANRGLFYLFWKADTRPLHQTIDAILAQGPGAIASAADTWFFCALAERDPAAAERALVALGDNPCWGESAIILSRSFGEGLLARMTKDEARARTAFEAARAQQEKIVQAQPDYGPALCVLGLIDAALGRKDLALDEGRRAIALTPVEKDVINGSRVLQYFAITAAWAGDKELALQQLEAGLRAPVASLMLSYGALKLFPVWDPLRGDPRFEKIVASLAPKQ